MRRARAVLLPLVLVPLVAGAGWGMARAAPHLGLEPAAAAALGAVAGLALAVGVLWGARAPQGPAGAGRLRSLGSRLAQGEPGPDGRAQPIGARTAVAMTDLERRQHLPGGFLSYLRAKGEGLAEGRATAWEVHYFWEAVRSLLRVRVDRDGDDEGAYRVTADLEDVGKWMESLAPKRRQPAWEAFRLRNPQVPQGYADSVAVAEGLAALGGDRPGGGPLPRIMSMALAVARPIPEGTPETFWVVEAEEGPEVYRYYCAVETARVLRREQIPSAASRPA